MNTQINEGINLSEGHLYETLLFCSLILELKMYATEKRQKRVFHCFKRASFDKIL
jgi:hypothetical protein